MSSSDLSSLGLGASDVLSSFGLLIPGVLLGLLAWATYRTGSTHLLLSRVWLLVFGRLDVSDQTIEDFLAKRDAFMKFRLVTGLKPRTLEQAKALITWCDENKEDVGDVKACGHYFDIEQLQLRDRLPGKQAMMVTAVLMFFLFSLTYMTGASAALLPPAFKVKASGNWYLVGDGVARQPRPFSEPDLIRIDSSDCKSKSFGLIPESDATVLCQLMGAEAAAFRASSLNGQRFILGVLTFTALLLWAGLVLMRRQIRASKAMAARSRG